ncbi:hypothetical protein SAMN04515618_11815 [Collimonas sp. OK307]|uniref:hypothetical protein n=1 Tax=Collimonas sp. OK307 TaxID=1801620 RepID=UPI0008F2E3C6|nr:hypothetical protein [Collimonas sp. OK307]SFI33816.1 hypothetical protein SAMN04515618_11815 [Collimonas sp. OK307]
MFAVNAIGWFMSGVFLVNVLPHLIRGISGDRFPSPFSKPHGKKLSHPTLNVIWAFINLSIFLTIFYFNHFSFTAIYGLVMLIGGFAMAIYLSRYFAGKDKE